MKIFLDSSYFVGLHVEKDPFHLQAEQLVQIIPPESQLYINNLIIYETATVLVMRQNRQTAINFGERIFNQIDHGSLRSVVVDEARERMAWRIFKQIIKKDVSFVDCSIIAMVKEFNIDTLVTFDKHFKPLAKKYRFKINQF